MSISTVHLVFKTHLDVGFTDLAKNVVRRYFDHYIPGALDLATAMRERGCTSGSLAQPPPQQPHGRGRGLTSPWGRALLGYFEADPMFAGAHHASMKM